MRDKIALAEVLRLKELKEPIKRSQQEAAGLIAPYLQDMDGTQADKFLFSPGFYSGVGKMSLEVYSRGMFSHMVGGDVDFLEMGVFGNDEIMRDKASQEYFDASRLDVVDELYRNNWFECVKPSLECAGAVGTDQTTIMGDYFNGTTHAVHWHPGDVYLGEDSNQNVDRIALRIHTTPQDLMDTGADVPESIRIAARSPKPARRKITLWAYWKALSPEEQFYSGMKWDYKMLGDDGTIYSTSYMHTAPGPSWRLEKMPRTAYGMGMGLKMYRDLLQSNKIQRLLLQEAEIRINPPMWIPNKNKDVYMDPGSMNYVDMTDTGQVPRRVVDPADMNPAMALKQEIDQLTRIHFYTDFFLQLTASNTRKTQEEIKGMIAETSAQVTWLVDSFERNYMNVSIRRTMLLMAEQGRLREPPRKLKKFIKENPAGQMGIRFIGPLAMARRYMYSIGKDIEMIQEMVVPLAQVDPANLDYLNISQLFDRGRQFMSGGRAVIRTQEEVDEIRQKRAEAEQAAKAAEMAMVAMTQNKQPEQGSPQAAMMEQSNVG